jgi:hypothetical protein
MTEHKNIQKQADIKLPDDDSQNNDTPSIPSEMIRKIAEKKPEAFMEMMAMEMGSIGNPLHSKMTPEHITMVLGLAVQHDERQYNLHKSSQDYEHSEGISIRRYWFASFVVVIILTILILYLFQNKTEILVPALTGLFGLIGGFIGGWGLGKNQNK